LHTPAPGGESSLAARLGVYRMTLEELAKVLAALGCPQEKTPLLAAQLDKRARQLAAEKGRTYEDALRHLLTLMQQGWTAQQKGL